MQTSLRDRIRDTQARLAFLMDERAADAERARQTMSKKRKTAFGELVDAPPDVGHLRKSADSAIEELHEAVESATAAAQRNSRLDRANTERVRDRFPTVGR